ncbi:MAG: TetR family transcriptional regulator [Rhodobacterales bacterium]|nr:TetR family transcriptional regulator [Rhodobacterales bacterium]
MRTGRDRQREETRRRLFDAALLVFREQGVDESRIDDIAQRAGVSRGTFYFHYPSKDDVLLQLMMETQIAMVDVLESVPDDAPIANVLGVVATRMAAQWQADPGMLAEIGMVALRRTAQNLSDLEESHPLQAALVAPLRRAADRGEIGALIPPELLSEFFLVNQFGAALAWCGNPMMPLEDLLQNVVTFFLRATAP